MLTFTKSMLALSVMAAVGGANATTYTEDTTLTDKIFTEGIVAINGATVTVTGDEIAGKWFKATNYSQDVGSKYSYEQSKLLLGNADTKKITINNSSTGFWRFLGRQMTNQSLQVRKLLSPPKTW